MQSGLLKLLGKLGIYMGIPSTALLSMLVMRFVNQSSMSHVQAPGAVLPNNRIELQPNRSANLQRLNNELEGKEKEESNKRKLISLDFPAVSNFGSKSRNIAVNKDTPSAESVVPAIHRNPANDQSYLPNELRMLRKGKSAKEDHPNVAGVQAGIKDQGSGSFNEYTRTEGVPEAASDAEAAKGHQLRTDQVVHALVLGDQKIRQGSVIKFRTQTSFMLNTHRVKPNTVFYAYARFDNERLQLYVNKMGTGTTQQPLHLVCRDEDDKEGIALHAGHGKWAEPAEAGKNAAVDELSSRVPLGGGIVSQLGHKLFQSGRQDEVTLNDGIEVNFIETVSN